ncbi:MAG: hypothetical protein H3C62_01565 [Gemmatimonadaceae bacterium]|nr:hypothetical protein [Gemmatimonadaceae bacterium]
MKILRTTSAAALGIVAGAAFWAAPLRAQITEVSRTPIADAAQVTFGYVCDDRFVIRNDGTKPIDLEYGLEKGNEHTRITLNAREEVELNSPSKASMELWMDGKLIARAMKEKRSCKEVMGNSSVTVNEPDVQTRQPTHVTNVYTGWGPPYPFYDPWAFGLYGSFGYYRPYYPGVRVSFPIIIGRSRMAPPPRRHR